MNKCVNGLMHIHSTYSFDGKNDLSELAALCAKKGYSYMLLSEHAEDYTPEKMRRLVAECKDLSSGELSIVPGLEYNCEGMHILALGIVTLLNDSTLEGLIADIHEKGGLAVLGHVVYYKSIPYERLAALDGIEIWNPRYEGAISPSIKSLGILKKFRGLNKNIVALGGLDLHKEADLGRIWLSMDAPLGGREKIFSALKSGNYKIKNGIISFHPLKDPAASKYCIIYFMRLLHKGQRLIKKFLSLFKNEVGLN
jgi:hypothetical protein